MSMSENEDGGLYGEPEIEKYVPTAGQRFREHGKVALDSVGMMYFDPGRQQQWRSELYDAVKLMNAAFRDAVQALFDTAETPAAFVSGVADLMIDQELERRSFEARMIPDPAIVRYDRATLEQEIAKIYDKVTESRLLVHYIAAIQVKGADVDLQRMIDRFTSI